VNSIFTSYFVLFVTNDLGNAVLFSAGTWKCNLAPRAYANACQQNNLWMSKTYGKIRHVCVHVSWLFANFHGENTNNATCVKTTS
jgi:hypothetical protein